MFSLQKGEDWTPKALWYIATIEDPWMEWESISMDFAMGLPKMEGGFDAIWVIVNRLTKSTHFLPIRATYPLEKLAQLYA